MIEGVADGYEVVGDRNVYAIVEDSDGLGVDGDNGKISLFASIKNAYTVKKSEFRDYIVGV